MSQSSFYTFLQFNCLKILDSEELGTMSVVQCEDNLEEKFGIEFNSLD
jgi:hypothetical protein